MQSLNGVPYLGVNMKSSEVTNSYLFANNYGDREEILT